MMNIATAITSGNNYTRYAVIMLYSLFCNNYSEEINVYILHDGLSVDELNILFSVCEYENSGKSKKIIPVYVDNQNFTSADISGFSMGTYFRLMMFDVLPQTIDRLLYLDVDIIINKSLSEFYNMDFEGNEIIACSHGKTLDEMIKEFNFGKLNPKRGECFNAGVVLYDYKNLKNKYSFVVFEKYLGNDHYYYDQGILNDVFWRTTKYIKTDVYNNRGMNHNAKLMDSVIIHYADANPWEMCFDEEDLIEISKYSIVHEKIQSCLNKYYLSMVRIWWDYAKYTDFYDTFKYEAEIIRDYYMNRLVKTYFKNMQVEYDYLKFKELLFEQILDGSFLLKLQKLGIHECSLYGMGYFGKYISIYLEGNMHVLSHFDKYLSETDDDKLKKYEEIVNESVPIIVCVYKDTESVCKEIEKITNVRVLSLKKIVFWEINQYAS